MLHLGSVILLSNAQASQAQVAGASWPDIRFQGVQTSRSTTTNLEQDGLSQTGYGYIHIYTYIHIYIYIHIYTYIHMYVDNNEDDNGHDDTDDDNYDNDDNEDGNGSQM